MIAALCAGAGCQAGRRVSHDRQRRFGQRRGVDSGGLTSDGRPGGVARERRDIGKAGGARSVAPRWAPRDRRCNVVLVPTLVLHTSTMLV